MELLGSGFFIDSSGERIGLIIKGKEVLATIYDSITPFTDECYKPKYPRSSCYIIHNNNIGSKHLNRIKVVLAKKEKNEQVVGRTIG